MGGIATRRCHGSVKGENKTQFRFPFIRRVLAHSNECVRREMRREYEAFPPFHWPMTSASGYPAYLHSFSCSYVGFVQLYKAFTLSVQGQCANCTRLYKATLTWRISNDFRKILCSFLFSKGGMPRTLSSLPFVHIHWNVLAHIWTMGT